MYTGEDQDHEEENILHDEVTQQYDDEHTMEMFNGQVTVKIGTGIADNLDNRYGNAYKGDDDNEDDDDDDDGEDNSNEKSNRSSSSSSRGGNDIDNDEEMANPRKWQEKQRLKLIENAPSNFEKAMKLAKIKIGQGKGSTGINTCVYLCVCVCMCMCMCMCV